VKETFMKRFSCIGAAAFAAATLAACNSQDASRQAAPGQKMSAAPGKSAAPGTETRSPVAAKSATEGAPVADTELSNKVRSVLTASNGTEIGGVDVAAADGVVTLNGTVQLPAEKDRAAILALGIDGVRGVVNNLVVIRGS
jgi:osmotically-inducible protein OsmY